MPQGENTPHANALIYWVIKFFCFPLIFGFYACSGHPVKLQVIEIQLLAIFNFNPCQRGVNQPQKSIVFESSEPH